MDRRSYYSNGKLLITGEYLVLEGALALAIPTIPGQEMLIEEGSKEGILSWESHYRGSCWFSAEFSIPEFKVIQSNEAASASYLESLLLEAKRLSSKNFARPSSLNITTTLGFSSDWGLGSSSSLINNLAAFFDVNAYELFFNTQKGSAYDIACAAASTPIFYRLEKGQPRIEEAVFNPPFKENIAFIYSGQKQDSRQSLSQFMAKDGFFEFEKGSISEISREIANTINMNVFRELIDEHEKIMSRVLDLPTVKETRFSDFPGSIKSLGAWGGDFILATAEIDFIEIISYFSTKGLDIVFSFDDLVLMPRA